jgi:hypothetical protein
MLAQGRQRFLGIRAAGIVLLGFLFVLLDIFLVVFDHVFGNWRSKFSPESFDIRSYIAFCLLFGSLGGDMPSELAAGLAFSFAAE